MNGPCHHLQKALPNCFTACIQLWHSWCNISLNVQQSYLSQKCWLSHGHIFLQRAFWEPGNRDNYIRKNRWCLWKKRSLFRWISTAESLPRAFYNFFNIQFFLWLIGDDLGRHAHLGDNVRTCVHCLGGYPPRESRWIGGVRRKHGTVTPRNINSVRDQFFSWDVRDLWDLECDVVGRVSGVWLRVHRDPASFEDRGVAGVKAEIKGIGILKYWIKK